MFNYESMFYNEVIFELEKEWGRKLNDHEVNVLLYGYKFGRLVEAENEIRILSAK
jgi:hypothetical protein